MAVLAAVGYIVLAVGLARSGTTTKGTAILIAIGGPNLLTMGGPLTPLLVLAALLLTAGHTLAARDDRRRADHRCSPSPTRAIEANDATLTVVTSPHERLSFTGRGAVGGAGNR